MPEEKLDRLVVSVTRLEEAAKTMRERMDKFDVDMQAIASSLGKTSDSLTKIRNIMVLVVVAIAASNVEMSWNLSKLIKMLGVG